MSLIWKKVISGFQPEALHPTEELDRILEAGKRETEGLRSEMGILQLASVEADKFCVYLV